MYRLLFILIIFLSFTIGLSFRSPIQNDEWKDLFNGKNLDGWDTWLGPPLSDQGNKLTEQPVGLNNDPNHVFTIVEQNGEKVIRISGEKWGAVYTKSEYHDFHFQLKFKWGSLTWGQKKNKKKDSGLLYFSVGPNGADYGAWMRSQEFQIEETNCGDYWGVAGGMEDIPAIKRSDSEYVYHPGSPMYTFSATSNVGRHCIKNGDAEKPAGEWNTVDLYCHGDTSVHVVNGKVMMVLYRSRQSDGETVSVLNKGKFQLQSEGAEVFYKQIRIRPLQAIPAELLTE